MSVSSLQRLAGDTDEHDDEDNYNDREDNIVYDCHCESFLIVPFYFIQQHFPFSSLSSWEMYCVQMGSYSISKGTLVCNPPIPFSRE